MKQAEQHSTLGKNVLGWREWAGLPELAIPRIKVKIDTGARTSALHAFYIENFSRNGTEYVRFGIHTKQRSSQVEKQCIAPIIERRIVTDSGGHSEERVVILTPIIIGTEHWPVEITLTNRDAMKFRMLLGRSALSGRYRIDTGISYVAGKPDADIYSVLAQGSLNQL
ncbi:MAG TPA: RimK/LysX family protein [Gammaproteobacteria bacterium]